MIPSRENYNIEYFLNYKGVSNVLENIIDYLEQLPGRASHEAQLINDLTIAYNNYVSKDDEEDNDIF